MESLLPALADAAHHDIVDRVRIHARSLDQRIEHGGGHVDRVPTSQRSAAAAARGPDGIDDVSGGLGHIALRKVPISKRLNSGPISNQC
jgi:hypothetical protein